MDSVRFEDVVRFHGHVCPGLAIGYRMTLAALTALDASRAEDEEIVAIVESNACGVDAVQVVSGCTVGKGNLLFKDYGKSVYSFVSRCTGSGVRVAWRACCMPASLEDDREARVAWILRTPAEEILDLRPIRLAPPGRAEMRPSVTCDRCGERVMDTRTRLHNRKLLCAPCLRDEVGHVSGESRLPYPPGIRSIGGDHHGNA